MKFLLLGLLLIVASCAHHRDVRPAANGKHAVMLNTEDKQQGFGLAKPQAEHYCEENGNKKAFFGKENYKYMGSMDEGSYNTSKRASKIAKGVGAAGMILGGKREQSAGGLLGVGGAVADEALGKGYAYTLAFTCR